MYHYDDFDAAFVAARVEQFRDQVARRLSGELTEEQFRPHRLMNGLYLQLHSYMLRIAVPYGVLNSRQMRKLAEIARTYDRGYGHFTTRQNIQFNWPALKDTPDILAELSSVEMHAIQTSGNCIRNVTADHFAGVAHDEIADPRPYAEILRQWSSLHPEFSFLPRKFKVAVNGRQGIGQRSRSTTSGCAVRNREGRNGLSGLGRRRPGANAYCSSVMVRECLPEGHLLGYVEAIGGLQSARTARQHTQGSHQDPCGGPGPRGFARRSRRSSPPATDSVNFPDNELARFRAFFAPPELELRSRQSTACNAASRRTPASPAFAPQCRPAQDAGLRPGHRLAQGDRRDPGRRQRRPDGRRRRPGRDYSHDEVRVSHEQNLILPHIALDDLPAVYDRLASVGLSTPNAGAISDIIACPGLDYCALATARSIPVAQRIAERFGDGQRAKEIGPLKIKISGCINACGHHHVGHIGILGLERAGEETYQITLGGSADEQAAIGQITGPGFSSENVVEAIETIVETYTGLRLSEQETFIDAYRRVGMAPFKEALYERSAGSDI